MSENNKHIWKDADNEQLADIQRRDGRFGVSVSTLRHLDEIGLNHLEIITLCGLIGKNLGKISECTGDTEFLNDLEESYRIQFVPEYKQSVTHEAKELDRYFRRKLDHLGCNPEHGVFAKVIRLEKEEKNELVK